MIYIYVKYEPIEQIRAVSFTCRFTKCKLRCQFQRMDFRFGTNFQIFGGSPRSKKKSTRPPLRLMLFFFCFFFFPLGFVVLG